MNVTGVALHGTVLAAVVAGVPASVRALRGDAGPGSPPARWWYRPGTWLAVVTVALLVNQVLFTVWALRVRHGDLSDLARAVPGGWFELADHNPAIGWLAAHFPAPGLLSLSALRIPSLLELPFGLLSYLTVLNWLDPRRYRQLTGPVVFGLACAVYTITFCLIEWALPTPYRMADVILRLISGVACAVALPALGRRRSAPAGAGAPRDAPELLVFIVSTAALGYLVLAMYDTALLYSLGRVGAHLPGALLAGAVLAVARLVAARLRRRSEVRPAGPVVDTLDTGLAWWLGLFLVPALAIRYELGFGSWVVAAAAGVLVIGVAAAFTLREVAGRLAVPVRVWLRQLAGALVAGVLSAAAGLGSAAAYPETRLLRAAVLFALAATLVGAGSDRAVVSRSDRSDIPRRQGSSGMTDIESRL
jgi:hypothetical protein